ncbi:MAG: lipoyl(octanoyl) transferase LipB [Acidobacteriota bacterium]
MIRELVVRRLGTVPYDEALGLQRALVEQRKAGAIPDTLLLLQHPHVLTLGVKGDGGRGHILAPDARLAELGVTVSETGRGGDVTYHGPGQLVGYPIIDLDPDRRDVHKYVRDLEEVMIRVCASYGVTAGRIVGKTGTWVRVPAATAGPAAATSTPAVPVLDPTLEPAKIGAIGVRISRWITSHGFAFNVWPDLEFFRLIVPCGIAEYGVTSLKSEIGVEIAMAEVEARFVQLFGAVFGRHTTTIDPSPP